MSDINTITIVGRLTKDVDLQNSKEFTYLPNGTPKMVFSIANSQYVTKNGQLTEESSFFNVIIFGKIVESIKTYMTKGKQIAITGMLKQDRWQDQTSGQNRDKIYIVADTIQLLGSNNTQPQIQQQQQQNFVQPQQNYAQPQIQQQQQQNFVQQQQPQMQQTFDNGFMNQIPF